MIMLLFALYITTDQPVNWKIMYQKRLLWLLVLWGVLPLTHLLGFWDTYLSSSLYSGQSKHLNICVDTVAAKLPQQLSPFILKTATTNYCKNGAQICITRWSMDELMVPCYPETRVYKKLADRLRKEYPNAKFHFIVYTSRQRIAEY